MVCCGTGCKLFRPREISPVDRYDLASASPIEISAVLGKKENLSDWQQNSIHALESAVLCVEEAYSASQPDCASYCFLGERRSGLFALYIPGTPPTGKIKRLIGFPVAGAEGKTSNLG